MTLPNLERKDLKLFANDAAAQDNIAVFGSLASANPQFSKDIEAIQNLPAFLQGWAGAITGDASPALEDFNALFYVLFYQMAYLFQKGVAQWKATTDYYKGSFTTDGNGALYASIVDNNVGNDPATDDGTHWNKFPTPAEVASKVAKSGDTMSGQLVMENGSNGIRFNGATADNYYYVTTNKAGDITIINQDKKGFLLSKANNTSPFYFDGTNFYRLLTTADLGGSTTITPVGSLIMGPIPEAQTPAGYLFCNGQAVSRTTYSALFGILGTNFGAGDGSTTFNVPDYRDCFLRGLGTQNNSFYVKQSQGLPNHSHKEFNTAFNNYGNPLTSVPDSFVAAAGIKRNTTDRDDYNLMVSVGNPVTPNAGNTGNASVSNSIYGASSEVRPVNYAINYFIKY